MIRQSRVTVPCGPALILVHVTRHFDFGRMRKMVQKMVMHNLCKCDECVTHCDTTKNLRHANSDSQH